MVPVEDKRPRTEARRENETRKGARVRKGEREDFRSRVVCVSGSCVAPGGALCARVETGVKRHPVGEIRVIKKKNITNLYSSELFQLNTTFPFSYPSFSTSILLTIWYRIRSILGRSGACSSLSRLLHSIPTPPRLHGRQHQAHPG